MSAGSRLDALLAAFTARGVIVITDPDRFREHLLTLVGELIAEREADTRREYPPDF
jgi:hypothetical protein